MFEINVVVHYSEDDPECDGDYANISMIVLRNGEEILNKDFGDYYHNKADDTMSGWVEGFKFVASLYGRQVIESLVNKADWKW
ncbi:MAG: hypothetical protein ACXAC2_00675 [Candidatus Kariarchaeaceae archaeon]|jgi:hypothetical protein